MSSNQCFPCQILHRLLVFSYTISVRYFVNNNYAWMDFLEYPAVIAQMVFLVSLSLVYKTPSAKEIGAAVGSYVLFFFAISGRNVTFPGPVILKLLLVSHLKLFSTLNSHKTHSRTPARHSASLARSCTSVPSLQVNEETSFLVCRGS